MLARPHPRFHFERPRISYLAESFVPNRVVTLHQQPSAIFIAWAWPRHEYGLA
jgi:hypothetical protein